MRAHRMVDLVAPVLTPRVFWVLYVALAATDLVGAYGVHRNWFTPLGSDDFRFFYTATSTALGHGNPYAEELVHSLGVLGFLYPPPFAIIFAPFVRLDLIPASRVFLALNVVSIPVVAALVHRAFWPKPLGLRSYLSILLAILLFSPVIETVLIGQINLMVVGLVLLAYLGTRQGRWFWSAAAIVLATMMKMSPALALLWLLYRYRNGRQLAYAGILTVILGVLAWVITYPEVYSDFLAGLQRSVSVNLGPESRTLAKLFAPFTILIGQSGPAVLFATLIKAAVALFALSVARATRDDDYAFVVVLTVMFFVPNLIWHHHLVFLIPVLGFLAARRPAAQAPERGGAHRRPDLGLMLAVLLMQASRTAHYAVLWALVKLNLLLTDFSFLTYYANGLLDIVGYLLLVFLVLRHRKAYANAEVVDTGPAPPAQRSLMAAP